MWACALLPHPSVSLVISSLWAQKSLPPSPSIHVFLVAGEGSLSRGAVSM